MEGLENRGVAGPTVLLVEDDPLIMFVSAEMLREIGCAVIEATDARAASAALETATIDVLMTDINLRGSSGIDVAAAARELRPGIGIIFASGEKLPPADDGRGPSPVFLAKPYGAGELREALNKIGARMAAHGFSPRSSPAL